MKRYLGVEVEVYGTYFTVCTRFEDGRTNLRQWPMRDLQAFAAQLKNQDELALEASGNTGLLFQAVANRVGRIVAVNANQLNVVSHWMKKFDKNEAETLALSLSEGLLPDTLGDIKLRRSMAQLAETRALLVKQRGMLKAKINQLLSAEGIDLSRRKFFSNHEVERLLTLPLPPVAATEVRVLAVQIRHLTGSILQLEELIEEESVGRSGYECFTSIPPAQPTVPSVEAGGREDAPDAGKLAAYFGLVPRVLPWYTGPTPRAVSSNLSRSFD